MRDFYAPREIHFSRKTALWLIHNLSTLREGHWPADASGRVEITGIIKTGSHSAPFETPILFAVEITRRLEQCGIDGIILLAIECWGESEATMARYLRMPEWSIRKRMKKALNYVASGPVPRWIETKKRKAETYKEFGSKGKTK